MVMMFCSDVGVVDPGTGGSALVVFAIEVMRGAGKLGKKGDEKSARAIPSDAKQICFSLPVDERETRV